MRNSFHAKSHLVISTSTQYDWWINRDDRDRRVRCQKSLPFWSARFAVEVDRRYHSAVGFWQIAHVVSMLAITEVVKVPHTQGTRVQIQTHHSDGTRSSWRRPFDQQFILDNNTALLPFVRGIPQRPLDSLHKSPSNAGPLFTKKTPSDGYRDPHYKPKTV